MTEAKVWRRVAEENRVVSALLLSIILHLGIYGGLKVAKRLGLELPSLPKWMQKMVPAVAAVTPPKKLPAELKPEEERVLNLTFVEVDASQAMKEPPKDAKYHSTQSTRAANPEPPKDATRDPKIDGKQTKVVKTIEAVKVAPTPAPPQPKAAPQPTPEPPAPAPPKVEVKKPDPPKPVPPKPEVARVEPPKPQPEPPKPTPPKPPQVDPTQPAPPKYELTEVQPPRPKLEKLPLDEPRKDSPKIGDLALAKPSPPPSPAPPPQPTATPQPAPLNPNVGDAGDAAAAVPVQRPRTLAEAKARMDGGMLIGEKMKQDGGVQRRGSIALDVRGSPFGAYDGKIIAAIQQAWYHLLADRLTPIGKVVIEFHLHANGRVSHLTMAGSEVGELYGQMCALAVQRPAPFDPWPREMRLALGAEYREVRFTFFYE